MMQIIIKHINLSHRDSQYIPVYSLGHNCQWICCMSRHLYSVQYSSEHSQHRMFLVDILKHSVQHYSLKILIALTQISVCYWTTLVFRQVFSVINDMHLNYYECYYVMFAKVIFNQFMKRTKWWKLILISDNWYLILIFSNFKSSCLKKHSRELYNYFQWQNHLGQKFSYKIMINM